MADSKPAEYYVPSPSLPLVGWIVTLVGRPAAGLVLGIAYGALQAVMPIIYLCFLVAVLFATVIGHVSLFSAKLGHCRHLVRSASSAAGIRSASLYGRRSRSS